MSKIMEHFILDLCTEYSCSKFQFGFVSKRSTAMATSFAPFTMFQLLTIGNDKSRNIVNDSPAFYCSLDPEGAFDAIPFPILFDSASHVLPVRVLDCMFYWYIHIQCVQIRWNNHLSAKILIGRGTRQGY